MTRVAVTGIGIVSPFGRGKASAIDALRNGRSGVRLIESIDTAKLNCRIGGEVPSGWIAQYFCSESGVSGWMTTMKPRAARAPRA